MIEKLKKDRPLIYKIIKTHLGTTTIEDLDKWIKNQVEQTPRSVNVDQRVMLKITEAFNRYLRSGNGYAKDNWTVNKIVKYEEDREYCKTIYNENRLKMNFDDAHDLARTKLFEKIIKEVFDNNQNDYPSDGGTSS